MAERLSRLAHIWTSILPRAAKGPRESAANKPWESVTSTEAAGGWELRASRVARSATASARYEQARGPQSIAASVTPSLTATALDLRSATEPSVAIVRRLRLGHRCVTNVLAVA